MSGLKSRPPVKSNRSVDQFIQEARSESVTASEKLPWEASSIRDDVMKVFNLRLPEPYMLKLRYIAEHGSRSMQRFCHDTLFPAIDEEIDRLTRS